MMTFEIIHNGTKKSEVLLAVPVKTDNIAAMRIVFQNISDAGTKHLATRYHYIRD